MSSNYIRAGKIKWFVFLHIIVFILAIGGVLSKFASNEQFMSFPFLALYSGEIAILFLYALSWQQIIKHIPLTVAFCNKSVSTIWSMLFGVLIFHEQLSIKMMLGAAIVLCGVFLVVRSDAQNE